jgi:hypothetical protein
LRHCCSRPALLPAQAHRQTALRKTFPSPTFLPPATLSAFDCGHSASACFLAKAASRAIVYSAGSAKIRQAHRPRFRLPNEYGEAPMNLIFSGGNSSTKKWSLDRPWSAGHPRLVHREVDPTKKS